MKQSIIRYGVGFDVSMKDFAVCFKALDQDEVEKIKGTHKFPNTAKGFKAAAAWIEQKRKDKNIPCRMVMEVTGIYHENLIYFLHEQGYYVSLELGKRVKSYLKSLGYDTKTDKEDAKGIASMALYRKLPLWQPASKEFHQAKQLIRHRSRLVSNRVAYHNQLHAHQTGHHPEPAVGRSIKRHIKQLNKEIKELDQQITTRMKADVELWERVKLIVDTLPGVGLLTMAIVLAETDAFSNVRSAKQLTRYAGYDIIEKQSGKFIGKTKISKQGNARLRSAMYMPAMSHLRTVKEGNLLNLYKRLMPRTGGLTKKATTAVQRKLLCLIYALWKSGQAYDPNHQPASPKRTATTPQNEGSPATEAGLHGIAQPAAELPAAIT
jgi:transposase